MLKAMDGLRSLLGGYVDVQTKFAGVGNRSDFEESHLADQSVGEEWSVSL